jgi:hypothetical protein
MRDAESGLPIILVTMSRDDASVSFLRADGKEARFPLGTSPFSKTSALARLHLAPTDDSFAGRVLLAVTVAGDAVVFELPSGDDHEQLAGRLVVYLDQNQWSVLSKASDPSAPIPDEDRVAALRLAGWPGAARWSCQRPPPTTTKRPSGPTTRPGTGWG